MWIKKGRDASRHDLNGAFYKYGLFHKLFAGCAVAVDDDVDTLRGGGEQASVNVVADNLDRII